MNYTRYCQVIGHQENNTTYICTYKNCQLDSRWVCIDCSVQQIHNHGQSNQNHLMKQLQFLDFIKQQSQPMFSQNHEDKKLIQICIKGLKYFMQSAQFLIQILEDDLATQKKNYNLEEIEDIINITKYNHFLLEDIQIQKIINWNNQNKKYQYNLSQDVLKQLIKLQQDLTKLLENNFKKQNVQTKQQNLQDDPIIQRYVQLVYQRYFDYKNLNQEIYTSQISYDEKYLAFGGNDCKIQVFDILTKQLITSIQIDNLVTICKFTKDSKYLLCGDSEGYLFSFDINSSFNQYYKTQVTSDRINDILPIDNDQIITCSNNKSIIITNIQQKTQQLLIKNAHNGYINTIDYDLSNDIIISGSDDNYIKFFHRTDGQMQFEKKNAHNNCVIQLQLIKNNNLLSSGCSNLILWQIDYHNKQLNNIKVLNQKQHNFTFVANNSRIIVICNDGVKILDENLSQLQLVIHNLLLGYYFRIRQIDSMNYIIVPSNYQFQVLKKV